MLFLSSAPKVGWLIRSLLVAEAAAAISSLGRLTGALDSAGSEIDRTIKEKTEKDKQRKPSLTFFHTME